VKYIKILTQRTEEERIKKYAIKFLLYMRSGMMLFDKLKMHMCAIGHPP
jgi:hypothetical protein